MYKRTKIVATIGPASDSKEIIKQLIENGVNVFRFNTKHNTPSWHEERIARVQNVADSLKTPIGIMLDLQGPEMRIETRGGLDIALKSKEKIDIYQTLEDKNALVALPYSDVFKDFHKGDQILIEDAYVELEVISKHHNKLTVKAIHDCVIKNRKGINLLGKKTSLPSLTQNDLKYLEIVGKNKIDFFALSFVRDVNDVRSLRKVMDKHNINASVVVKIENAIALENITSLVEAADVVMVARGDLGIEVPIEELAFWQNNIIEICRQKNKPVITATQMLESMMENPYPTRSEATDIANAIAGGTDAIMLSGETAAGKYPLRCVQVMSKIAIYNERMLSITKINKQINNKTDMLARLALDVANEENILTDKFLVFTQTGSTAKALSSLRPKIDIIAVTENQKTIEQLTLTYGVETHRIKFPKGSIRNPEYAIKQLTEKGILKKGENIIMIHGSTWKLAGTTNTLSIIKIK